MCTHFLIFVYAFYCFTLLGPYPHIHPSNWFTSNTVFAPTAARLIHFELKMVISLGRSMLICCALMSACVLFPICLCVYLHSFLSVHLSDFVSFSLSVRLSTSAPPCLSVSLCICMCSVPVCFCLSLYAAYVRVGECVHMDSTYYDERSR
uniref:Uncharacterized protein n=1 Tax=Parascaris univalens TaxID=6257 RepID=A0A914ZTW2_PARUN